MSIQSAGQHKTCLFLFHGRWRGRAGAGDGAAHLGVGNDILHVVVVHHAELSFRATPGTGPIGDIPEMPGILVWKPGHIGVYIGSGEVIESNSTKAGVIKTKLTKTVNETRWKYWLKCPYLTYPTHIPEGEFISHTVVKGESLSKIARHYLGAASRFKEIAELNGIIYPYVIHQNQVLKVPKK